MTVGLAEDFYHRPCLEVARDLVGKVLVRGDKRLRISETESYCGEEDTACHAHKGRTKRTEVMYMEAGTIYVYLCYGMHWMLNIVTGEENVPEAVDKVKTAFSATSATTRTPDRPRLVLSRQQGASRRVSFAECPGPYHKTG